MPTLIWKWVQFLEEATFSEFSSSNRPNLIGREFKEVLKCLSKRNRVTIWSEIGNGILGYV